MRGFCLLSALILPVILLGQSAVYEISPSANCIVSIQPDSSFADRLFSVGLFEEAITEYMRESDSIDGITELKIGFCHYALDELSEAIEIWEEISKNSSNLLLRQKALIACAISSLENGDIETSIDYSTRAGFSSRELDMAYHGHWSELGIAPPRSRSIPIASLMSIVLPGSGQIYCGDFSQGIKSMLLNGTFIYSSISSATNGYIPRAFTIFILFGNRYWFGGSNKAGLIAESFNRREKTTACKKLGEFVNWPCE